MSRTNTRLILALAAALPAAGAYGQTWNGTGTDRNWSVNSNWNPAGPITSTSTPTFAATGAAGNASTVTSAMDLTPSPSSIAGLSFNYNNSALFHRVNLNGNTLQIDGNFAVATTAGGNTRNVSASFTNGSLGIGSSSALTLWDVAYSNSNQNNVGSLDLSSLASSTAWVNSLRVGFTAGNNPVSHGTLLLPTSANINTNSITVSNAEGGTPGATTSVLRFGSGTSTIIATTTGSGIFTVAGIKGNGRAEIASGGTLNIGSVATRYDQLRIGYNNFDTGAVSSGHLDMTGGTLNAYVNSVILGHKSNGGLGSGVGTLTLSAGLLDVTTITLANTNGNPGGTSVTRGTLNVNGGTVIALTIHMGNSSSNTGSFPVESFINLTPGGTLAFTTINHGTNTNSNSSRTINISGGTIRAATTAAATLGGGTSSNGGIGINVTGSFTTGETSGGTVTFNQGATPAKDTFVLDFSPTITTLADTTINRVISEAGGARSLTKAGAATLTLGRVNTFTGETSITGGTLTLGAAGSIDNSSGVAVSSGATFNVAANGFTVGSGKTLLNNGDVIGALNVQGMLAGAGSVSGGATSVGSGATIRVGSTHGTFGAVAQTFTLGTASLLGTTEVDLVSAGVSERLSATALTLGGTLNVANPNGILFADGQVYDLFDFNTLSGIFDSIILPALSHPELEWDQSNLYVDGTIRVNLIPEPASLSLLGLGGLALLRRRQAGRGPSIRRLHPRAEGQHPLHRPLVRNMCHRMASF